ncbi:MAG: hypothetical protein B0D92_02045 [Spirochaeta sp. LUC14_002_19_P3]|nr:MAG: hypothetical protein B0D92_02045 [Spirochaeta sp. LUC14_002_19_P3]
MKNNLILTALLLASCAVINTTPFEIDSYPKERNQELPANAVPWVQFPENVSLTAAENAVEISNAAGIFDCDYSWENRRLSLSPRTAWTPGSRYALKVAGQFSYADGRVFKVKHIIPFFIGAPDSPPVLKSQNPENETIIAPSDTLTLEFSKAMNTALFAQNITFSPDIEVTYSWNTGADTVLIAPQEEWTPLSRFTITLPNTLTDAKGIPLAEDYTITLRTYSDITAPAFTSAHPWSISTSQPLSSLTLNDINADSGIYLLFSEAMDWDTWDASWSIEPALTFSILPFSESAIALIPEARWIPEQQYTLSIDETLKDAEGNALAAVQDIAFTCPIPRQRVLSIAHSTADPLNDLSTAIPKAAVPLTLDTGPKNTHTFMLTFAQPITVTMLPKFVSTFSLTASFPSSISSPKLVLLSLTSNTTLELGYEGFTPAVQSTQVHHYYQLSQRAEEDDTVNSDGSYLTEDWDILYVIEAAP